MLYGLPDVTNGDNLNCDNCGHSGDRFSSNGDNESWHFRGLNNLVELSVFLPSLFGAMEMRCYRKLLGITYLDRATNDNIRRMIKEAIGPYDELLSIVKKRKMRCYGHVMRSTGLSKTILQGTVEGTRRRGGLRRRWEDDITKWTGLGPVETMRLTKDRHRWIQLSATSTVVPQRSSRSRDSE